MDVANCNGDTTGNESRMRRSSDIPARMHKRKRNKKKRLSIFFFCSVLGRGDNFILFFKQFIQSFVLFISSVHFPIHKVNRISKKRDTIFSFVFSIFFPKWNSSFLVMLLFGRPPLPYVLTAGLVMKVSNWVAKCLRFAWHTEQNKKKERQLIHLLTAASKRQQGICET